LILIISHLIFHCGLNPDSFVHEIVGPGTDRACVSTNLNISMPSSYVTGRATQSVGWNLLGFL
jgi:hypothetical protein